MFSFTIVSLIITTSAASAPPNCNQQNVSDAVFRGKYLFLQKNVTVSNNQRSSTGQNPKTLNKWCPWTWAVNDDRNRIPRYLPHAKCQNCGFRCVPITYNHRVMKWADHCDKTTGDKFWNWKYVPLNVAFVDTGITK